MDKDMELKISLHNTFDFVVRDAETGEVIRDYRGEGIHAENILLANFWSVFISSSSVDCLKYIHFGSGATTPAASDVKLTSWLGYKTAPTYEAAGTKRDFTGVKSNHIFTVRKTVRLEDTEYVGSTISEVGYSNSTSGTSGLLTKALVKDANGNIVSITKNSGEVLDIYATFTIDMGDTFNGGKVVLARQLGNGEAYPAWAVIQKALMFRSSWSSPKVAWMRSKIRPHGGLFNTIPSGDYEGSGSIAYDVSNKKITFTLGNVVAANGNLTGGIKTLVVGGLQIELPCTGFTQPVLTKEVMATGDGSTKDFQTKFGYMRNNGTAIAYVNDVETSATFAYDRPYPKSDIVTDMIVVDFNVDAASDYYAKRAGYPGISTLQNFGDAGAWIILENPLYSVAPITAFSGSYLKVSASNDLTNWVSIETPSSVQSAYQSYRYWKIESSSASSGYVLTNVTSAAAGNLKNVHFATAPASGATVASTYQPDCIAKDSSHVLNNITVALTFNEYAP